jgi:hypothetical protein
VIIVSWDFAAEKKRPSEEFYPTAILKGAHSKKDFTNVTGQIFQGISSHLIGLLIGAIYARARNKATKKIALHAIFLSFVVIIHHILADPSWLLIGYDLDR